MARRRRAGCGSLWTREASARGLGLKLALHFVAQLLGAEAQPEEQLRDRSLGGPEQGHEKMLGMHLAAVKPRSRVHRLTQRAPRQRSQPKSQRLIGGRWGIGVQRGR